MESQTAKADLGVDTVGRTVTPGLRLHYRALTIKTAWCCVGTDGGAPTELETGNKPTQLQTPGK